MAWEDELFRPIELPRCRHLITVRDAAEYIARLPARERSQDYWQPAGLHLRLCSEDNGCVFFARQAVMYGLRKGVNDAPATAPRKRRARAYKLIR